MATGYATCSYDLFQFAFKKGVAVYRFLLGVIETVESEKLVLLLDPN